MNRRPEHPESGQAMVEFAMGAVALFAILFGLMSCGYTFGKQLDLQGATRTAARKAAIRDNDAEAVTYARQVLADNLALTDGSDVTFTIDPPPPWNHGDEIRVRSRTPHDFNVIGITAWSGTLRAETTIRVE